MNLSNERIGKFTASGISKLFVGGKGATRDTYIFEKAEELFRGHAKLNFSNRHTEHGHLNEFEAIEQFKLLTGLEVDYLDQKFFPIDENSGATPDAAVVDFSGVIEASVDVKCPTESFCKQKMLMVLESKPEFQNSPKEMFYQAQMQMMALSEHNKKLGHPEVTKHYLVRYMTSSDTDENENKVEYDIPLNVRMFYKVITADAAIQESIREATKQAATERDVLVKIFNAPML